MEITITKQDEQRILRQQLRIHFNNQITINPLGVSIPRDPVEAAKCEWVSRSHVDWSWGVDVYGMVERVRKFADSVVEATVDKVLNQMFPSTKVDSVLVSSGEGVYSTWNGTTKASLTRRVK